MPASTRDTSTDPLQQAVATQFATRPTLRDTTAQMLSYLLKEKYPPLTLPPSELRLAQPSDGGGRALLPLLTVALKYLATGSYPDMSTRDGLDCYLSDATGNRLTYQSDGLRYYDLHTIEAVIRELAQVLFISFQDALAMYWGQADDAHDSRWKWLADMLQARLRLLAVKQEGSNAGHLRMLSALARCPDREDRARQPWPDKSLHAYTLETCLDQGAKSLTVQSTDLLLVDDTQVLLCGLSGRIESFASLDAFGKAWGERMSKQYVAGRITWNQYEPDGNIFEVQAALVFNQQLDDLAAIRLPADISVSALEQLFAVVTDPARQLSALPGAYSQRQPSLKAALPDWLQNASPADRFTYHHYVLEQAIIKREALGDPQLAELDSIGAYATSHLNHQLCLDRNQALHGTRTCTETALAEGYDADDLQLTFRVPVGDSGSSYVEPVAMSLVDLALKNLSGRPLGSVTLSHRKGRMLEDWLTPDYIFQLIQRVNIGLNYPNYIRQELIDDTEAAQKRRRLFKQQRPLQLKTQALEYKLQGLAGLTARGVRYVAAVLNEERAGRWVGETEIVMRPLAFLRKPGASADVVQNMFVIEARDPTAGPHVLYRPAYAQALREFGSRADLLAAIVETGELQTSVLTWLPERARPIYSNGGFVQPHYVRVIGGSEFDPLPSVPAPATLAGADDESAAKMLLALSTGTLWEYLFECEAHQLLAQAEEASTSDTESRWALIVEGMLLGFNTLLMAVRGPLAVVGWLLQLMQSLKQDLPALESTDPTTRELAWVDVLMNIGLLLLHQLPPPEPPLNVRRDQPETEQALARLPFRRSQTVPASAPPVQVRRGVVGLPSEPAGGGRTLLDFDRSVASTRQAARLLEKLLAYNVPWPDPIPEQIEVGFYKGLYRIDGKLHASVSGLLFRIGIIPGFGEVFIIHPDRLDHPGIPIRSDDSGHWRLDFGLRLAGGGPKRVATLRAQNLEKKNQLLDRMEQINAVLGGSLEPPVRQSLDQMAKMLGTLKAQRQALVQAWDALQRAAPAQRPVLEASHQREVKDYASRSTLYRALLENLTKRVTPLIETRLTLVPLARELRQVALAGADIKEMETILEQSANEALSVCNFEREWLQGLQTSRTGQSMRDLAQSMFVDFLRNDRTAYDEYIAKAVESADTWLRMADAAAQVETVLEQLADYSPGGVAKRLAWLKNITDVRLIFAQNLKLNAMSSLALASVDRSDIILPPQESLYYQRLRNLELPQTVLSHIEVRSSNDYALEDQRNVYESIIDKYRRYANALQALKSLNSKRLHPSSERLLEALANAQALAQRELETVVSKQEQLDVTLPISKTLPAKPATRRVFKSRRRGYLIGDVGGAAGPAGREQMTITDSGTGETIASFERIEDEWVDKAPPLELPSLNLQPLQTVVELRTQGQKLIGQRADIERQVNDQKRQLDSPLTRQQVDPADWDILLTGHARKLTDLAVRLERDHANSPTAQRLIAEYHAHAQDLRRKAVLDCSSAYKQQWPTPQSVTYLWDHQQIDINLTSAADPERPTLSGDFFTEYAVYDKATRPPQVLWYAHFHYPSATTAAASYSRAHLKLREQRKFTQKDLLKQHVQEQLSGASSSEEPVKQIVYVLIKPPLDQLFLAIAPQPVNP
ncbi:hypothetical protein [Pseudomonas sp. W4I3]|uniref:hypothetical protein n=1 Tax=Pseudomonas sp. W4I3 TaxID=3042294 RepID=UPI002782E0C2|nr:hypothetical protein [Pseudomonas sp. W4I3]MDQ0740033.1 hypothetical protein [Pseudomonas sp. W4I3]